MGLLALQFGIQPIVTKKFTSPEINKSTVIFTQEIVKLLIAMIGITLNTSTKWKDITSGWSIQSWLRLALLPATIYLIQNLCSLLAYQNLDAITYNVLNQTKTLSAALCCFLLLGKRQSKLQIVALVILLVAALVMEGILPLNLEYYMNYLSNTTAAADSNETTKFSLSSRHVSHGVLPIMLASFLSGLAGAITQKSLQSGGGRNALMFTMELCVASILILLVSFATSDDGKKIQERGFFDQWTFLTLVPILTNSAGGILVGLVIKYAGTIRKGFALIFGILISGIVQSLIDENKTLSKEDIAGGVLAALSLWMHASFPHIAAPKTNAKLQLSPPRSDYMLRYTQRLHRRLSCSFKTVVVIISVTLCGVGVYQSSQNLNNWRRLDTEKLVKYKRNPNTNMNSKSNLNRKPVQSESGLLGKAEAPLQPHNSEECSSIFLYVTDVIGQYGLGYQLNNYILAVLLASYLNRSIVVLDPPIHGDNHSKFSSNSQFGCPLDDLNNTNYFRSGLGRIIDYPAWLNKGCGVPCIGEHDYSFWHGVAQSKESRRNEVSPDTEHRCIDEDGRNVSVLSIGGDLRHLLMSPKYNVLELARKSPAWVSRIGATQYEARWLANHSQNLSLDSIYDQISALLSRAGVVTFQPWINREVHSFISRFDDVLPKNYVAFNVRRGNELTAEAKYWVDEYWAKQGYNETTQPSNYIPISHYLEQVQNEQESGVLTNVYIATDDQDSIKREIDELSGFSNVSFYMNPDTSPKIHLQSDLECSIRYNRTIAAIADLKILSQSDIFVGEYNSNEGRLVHTARTSFVDGEIGTARQLDMRIAFGPESRGIPGT